MPVLHLSTTKAEEQLIKDYLEENVSDVLAEKINDGVLIEKDGKRLLNKKTLDTFMKYASEEAKKQAEKGARFACVENETVYGWAIHYFEEDSLEGLLFNEDGTEFKSVVVAPKAQVKPAVVEPPKPKMMTLFDLMEPQAEPEEAEEPEPEESEEDEEVEDGEN